MDMINNQELPSSTTKFNLSIGFFVSLLFYMVVYFYDDVLISKASNSLFLFSFSFFASLSCFKTSREFSGNVLSVAWMWFGLGSLFWSFGQLLCLFNFFSDYVIPSQVCFSFTAFFPVFFILGSFYYRSWLPQRAFNDSQLQILSGVIVAVMILDYIAFYEPYSDVILNTDFYAFLIFENVLYLVSFIFSFTCYFFYIRYEGGGDFFLLILSLFLQFIAFVFYGMSRFDLEQDWQNIWNLFSVISFFLIIYASTSDSIKKHHVVSSDFSEPYLYRLPENTVPFLLFGSLLTTSFFLKEFVTANNVFIFSVFGILVCAFLGFKEYKVCGMNYKLYKKLAKFKGVVDCSPNMIVITDIDGVIEYSNEAHEAVTGFSGDQALGRKDAAFNGSFNGDIKSTLEKGQKWTGVLNDSMNTGSLYWVKESVIPMPSDDGNVTNYVAYKENITKTLSAKLEVHSTHDALTGFINRMEFDRQLDFIVRGSSDYSHSILYIDINSFKFINDSLGRSAGDELLFQFSRIFLKAIRGSDLISRVGGDEFIVLLQSCTLQRAQVIAEGIRDSIKDYVFIWDGRRITATVSLGILQLTSEVKLEDSDIFFRANTACTEAKKEKEGIHVFDKNDDNFKTTKHDLFWVDRIQSALARNDFFLVFQPIVDTVNSDQFHHFEVLIRLDENGSTVSPGTFLPAAERFNLAIKIDYWVIDTLFDLLESSDDNDVFSYSFSINLSGQSLGDKFLLGFIKDRIKNSAMDSKNICFEVTETAAISNFSLAIDFMNELREFGCKFSLDDFGTGLSSFAYLKNLPVDYLKIDGHFVKDMVLDDVDREIVKSIHGIGSSLGKKTIAEFVETDDILKLLEEIGVDYAQGYCVGMPLLFDDLLRLR